MTGAPEPLVAFVSYQSADFASSETLHIEHALRGMTVIHDRCTFAVGTRIPAAMSEAVTRCDAFIPLLTPNSLYEAAPPDAARPALDSEMIPVFKRRRAALAEDPTSRRPVIAAVTHDLGDPRTEAPQRVYAVTGESIDSLWSFVIDQTGDAISDADAAKVAGEVLDALLPPGKGPDIHGAWPVTVASRGEGEPPTFLTIDATPILGGADHRPGESADWDRFLAGMRDVERTLARWTGHRRLAANLKTHLTGAFAFGRVFHHAAGWDLQIANRAGMSGSTSPASEAVSINVEDKFGTGPLVVSADLIGHDPAAMINRTIQTGPMPCGRIEAVRRDTFTDMAPGEIVASSRALADRVRQATSRLRPTEIALFLVTPAPFAALLGQQLTALSTDIQLFERAGDVYVPSLRIPAAMS